jgi:ParB-like chromosome segregation protein Spo0J
VIEHQEIARLLATIGKDRRWLAKQVKLSENTIRQYLGPKGKRTIEFMEEVTRVIALEAARQKEIRPDAPPWNQIFETDEQFDRADVASRAAGAESFKAFCREAILAKADEILEKKRRGAFPKMKSLPGAKVAEGKE